MLRIHNFSFGYPDHDHQLINNWHIEIPDGEKVVLLGSNGVGKSSILKALWESSFSHLNWPVSRAYFPQDIPARLDLNRQKLTESIYEVLFQFCQQEFPYIDFEPLYTWLGEAVLTIPKDYQKRLQNNLFQLKLSPGSLAENYADWSPGTKKKFLLSILFATDPKVILADEITNHLDLETVQIVTNWIQNSRASMLLVDHNQDFLNTISRHFLFLPNNQKRQIINLPGMSFDEVLVYLDDLQARQKIEQDQFLRRKKQLEKQIEMLRFRAEVFNADVGSAMKAAQTKFQKEIVENQIAYEQDLRKNVVFKSQANQAKIKKNLLIEVKDLEFLIGSNKSQLVSRFKLYQHQRVQIQGPNGRGKSTLLKFIQARLEKGGEFHKDLDQYLRGEINIFNLERQQIFSLQQVTNYPVGYSLESYLQAHTDLMPYHIPNFLKNLELHKFSNHSNLSHLSMGEFIRLQLGVLARIQHTIKLLILDEPGNFLDVFTQKALVHLLQNYTGALLIVSHDPKLVAQIDIEESLELK